MATNVTFFRGFAEDMVSKTEEYYFEHSRPSLDFSNIFDSDSDEDNQLKLFHYTKDNGVTPDVNESGGTEGVRYRGKILALYQSKLDQVIDVQKGVDKDDGKYTLYVQSLIESGGLLDEISKYNACNNGHELIFSELTEVYNFFDYNADGVWFSYELYIRN